MHGYAHAHLPAVMIIMGPACWGPLIYPAPAFACTCPPGESHDFLLNTQHVFDLVIIYLLWSDNLFQKYVLITEPLLTFCALSFSSGVAVIIISSSGVWCLWNHRFWSCFWHQLLSVLGYVFLPYLSLFGIVVCCSHHIPVVWNQALVLSWLPPSCSDDSLGRLALWGRTWLSWRMSRSSLSGATLISALYPPLCSKL